MLLGLLPSPGHSYPLCPHQGTAQGDSPARFLCSAPTGLAFKHTLLCWSPCHKELGALTEAAGENGLAPGPTASRKMDRSCLFRARATCTGQMDVPLSLAALEQVLPINSPAPGSPAVDN